MHRTLTTTLRLRPRIFTRPTCRHGRSRPNSRQVKKLLTIDSHFRPVPTPISLSPWETTQTSRSRARTLFRGARGLLAQLDQFRTQEDRLASTSTRYFHVHSMGFRLGERRLFVTLQSKLETTSALFRTLRRRQESRLKFVWEFPTSVQTKPAETSSGKSPAGDLIASDRRHALYGIVHSLQSM